MSLQDDKRIYQRHGRTQQPIQAPLTRSLHPGIVVDRLLDNRIIVRIKGLDDQLTDDQLPICTALIPLQFGIIPKKQEVVQIILSDVAQPYQDRFWVGPSITHYRYLPTGQPYLPSKRGVTINEETRHSLADTQPLTKDNKAKGLYPENEDDNELWLNSRGKSDIRIGSEKLEIRTGKTIDGEPLVANPLGESAIRLYAKNTKQESIVDIEAEIIQLIGRLGENEATHNVARADVTTQILQLMMVVIKGHRHPYHGKEPIQDEAMKAMLAANIENINSPGVRVN